jgi:aspartate carbamoyltransferase regulatory subunit
MPFEYFKNDKGEFVCPHCQKVTQNQSTMNMHYNAKHNGDLKHQCEYCPTKFSQKSMLDLHMAARHNDILEKQKKEVKKFECPCRNCDFTALTKANRRIHFARMHMKDLTESLKTEDLSCKSCKKAFKSGTAFYYHVWGCVKPNETHPSFQNWKTLCEA